MFCSTSRASRSSRTAESPLSQGCERQRCRRACRLNNYLTSRFFVCVQQCQEITTLNERSPQHIIQDPGQVASKQMPVDVPFTCIKTGSPPDFRCLLGVGWRTWLWLIFTALPDHISSNTSSTTLSDCLKARKWHLLQEWKWKSCNRQKHCLHQFHQAPIVRLVATNGLQAEQGEEQGWVPVPARGGGAN